MPRLVGAAAAVELIVANPLKQNRLLRAEQAAELGLADALLDDVEFLDDSIEWLVRAIEEERAPRAAADLSDAQEICARARYSVDDVVHGVALAPYRALELIAGAAGWTVEEGYAAEERRSPTCCPALKLRLGFTLSTRRAPDQAWRRASPTRSHAGSRRSESSGRG